MIPLKSNLLVLDDVYLFIYLFIIYDLFIHLFIMYLSIYLFFNESLSFLDFDNRLVN